MKFAVTNRFTGAIQFEADIDCAADTERSIKLGLAVRWAIKGRANLSGAYLRRAYLGCAYGLAPQICTPLLMLLDQPGPLRAYKLVNAAGQGTVTGGLKYIVGKSVSVEDANTDPTKQCGAGINVATLDWCLKGWRSGYRILVVEFDVAGIACIPTATDGKFRLHRCKVIAEKELDYIALGLVKTKESEEVS